MTENNDLLRIIELGLNLLNDLMESKDMIQAKQIYENFKKEVEAIEI